MEKLYTSKIFSKMASGRMHTSSSYPLDPSLAISYKTIKKVWHISVTLGPLIFLLTDKVKRRGPGEGMVQR